MNNNSKKTFLSMGLISLLLVGASIFLCIYSKWNVFAIISLVISSGSSLFLFIMHFINNKKENE